MKTQDGRLYVIGGASRSGKTVWTSRAVAKSKRITAWDPEDQWSKLPGWRRVATRKDLVKALTSPGPFKIAYVRDTDLAAEFEFWAGCVFHAGRYVAPLDCIGEELADVSTPAKAPPRWGVLVRRGLKRGINIYAISQRWSEADKTAVGNASAYVLFRQSSADDVRYLARKTRVPAEQLDALKPLEFITLDAGTGEIVASKLKF
jgi:hypothetical protein